MASYVDKKAVLIADYKDGDDGTWSITSEGRKFLSMIDKELCIVGIAGAMRTGKSYIMNLLADKTFPEKQVSLFDLGATTEGKTRGVWAYVKPLDRDPSKALLLLDFEGMHDPARLNAQFDAQIFVLAVLISSYFVYNTMNTINQDFVDKLAFIANIGDQMMLSSTCTDGDEVGHSSQFPDNFTWIVRDFYLKETKCDNDYLEEILVNQGGNTRGVAKARNDTRFAISSNFKNRTCFTLPRPAETEGQIQRLDELPFSSLRPEFRAKLPALVNHILDNVQPKKIKDHRGIAGSRMTVKGPELLVFLDALLTQLNTSRVFCVEDAWKSVSRLVTQTAFNAAIDLLVQLLDEICTPMETKLPIDSEAWTALEKGVMTKANQVYIDGAILRDDEHLGAKALSTCLDNKLKDYHSLNMQASNAKVKAKVNEWVDELRAGVTNRVFEDIGAYEQRKCKLMELADATKGLGPAAAGLKAELLEKLKDVDLVAVTEFKLGAQEVELQKLAAETHMAQAAQEQLKLEMDENERAAMAREKLWKETQAKLQEEQQRDKEEYNREMEKQRAESAAALAQAMKDGNERLQAALAASARKHEEDFARMTSKHTADMQELQANSARQIADMRAEAERNRAEDQKRLAAAEDKAKKAEAEASEAAKKSRVAAEKSRAAQQSEQSNSGGSGVLGFVNYMGYWILVRR